MTLAYVSRHEDIPTRMHAMFDLHFLYQGRWIWYGRQATMAEALRLSSKHRARTIQITPAGGV